jgi:hypothetical protein
VIHEDTARQLRAAGLRWQPASGDTFAIDRPGMEGERFTVSDMTIEPHHFDTGTILGFNGTTEWALDSVEVDEVLWLPREQQLRELLGEHFLSLEARDGTARVTVEAGGERWTTDDADVECAYAEALLAVLERGEERER